ncbi:MAG: alpha/beta fold hydrolase [Aureispira sp.]|nr:alpha/beta fold hydrolase [Aureispira sp.]
MQLNYKVFGQGDPIIILHGMFGTLDNWQTIAKQLAKNFMVFIVDLRNHGRSPHSDELSYSIMAEDLHAFMEANWIYHAHIIGHSMGGKVAMQFALEHDDMVDKLIIVDIAPVHYKGNHQTIFKALFSLDLDSLSSRKEADVLLQSYIPEFSIRQFLLKNLYIDKESNKYKWKMNLPVIHEAYQNILSHTMPEADFTGETLFIRGGKSDYIKENNFLDHQKYFPEAQLSTVDDAGHWVHAEQPKAFLETLLNFLND